NTLFVRVVGEERRGRDLLLVTPDHPGSQVTALVLKDNGQSLFRSLEATVSFRPAHWGNLNASYVRSSSLSDTGSFVNSIGTFEKLVITTNRYAHSRSDAPNRFLAWGDLRPPGTIFSPPAVAVPTGFPFAFVDADANVPPIPVFGLFPRFPSLDPGMHRVFGTPPFDRHSKLRLGFA